MHVCVCECVCVCGFVGVSRHECVSACAFLCMQLSFCSPPNAWNGCKALSTTVSRLSMVSVWY